MKYDCLIIDDEETLSQNTCEYFNMFDVKSYWVPDFISTFEFFKSNETELILLDINIGEESGFDLCKKLRETITVPILFISARTSTDDMLLALGIGGDDYIQKPYPLSVLLAKVKAVLKRYKASISNSELCAFGEITIDFASERVTKNGEKIELKSKEYSLLIYLIKNKNRMVTKEELFSRVWKDSFTGDGTLNVHIHRLREKIEKNPIEPQYIKTVWGRGYIFEEKK